MAQDHSGAQDRHEAPRGGGVGQGGTSSLSGDMTTAQTAAPGAAMAMRKESATVHDIECLTIDTVRTLAMDAVEQAHSGHPGTPMGLAPLAYALWTHGMSYLSDDPTWLDRDRFVLSCGHASMLQYAMLHLTGYDLSLDAIRNFRQLGSPAAGHPERGEVPGVETTTGPLGQGIANAVGMALAESMLAARFNTPAEASQPPTTASQQTASEAGDLVDHRTWVIASDGDLMEGVAYEAASLAGHLGLHKLCVFWDDNRITIDGSTDLSFTEDVVARFQACGWHVLRVPFEAGVAGYCEAIDAAMAETTRPTFVACQTHIGWGSPGKQDRSAAHGAPLGAEEVARTREAIGWPHEPFHVPKAVREHMTRAGTRAKQARDAWRARLEAVRATDPARVEAFEAAFDPWGSTCDGGSLEQAHEALNVARAGLPRDPMATRKASGRALAALSSALPLLVGGSCDLAGSNQTRIAGGGDVARQAFAGRNLNFGVREHAMGGVLNGLALHGGLRPYGGTFLVFADYMRPAMRLAALMQLPVIYVFTHDSIGVGEDGPTHQPIEHLASLRAIPNLHVIRPADAEETIEAWRAALGRSDGPTALVLTRQSVPALPRGHAEQAPPVAEGAYVLRAGGLSPDVALMATGSEVALAVEAAELLQRDGMTARVISMPCWERISSDRWRELIGDIPCRVAVEAGIEQGWHRWMGERGCMVGLSDFGASAPGSVLMEHFGLTAQAVAEAARRVVDARDRDGHVA